MGAVKMTDRYELAWDFGPRREPEGVRAFPVKPSLGGDDVAPLKEELERALPRDRTGLAVVFYHTDADDTPFRAMRSGVAPNYPELVSCSAKAVKKFEPTAQIFNLTDPHCKIFEAQPDTLIRLPVNRDWVGYERCRAWLAFCQCWSGRILFLDTDMFVANPLNDLFSRPFDFALTWRPPTAPAFENMPINGGMFIVNNCRKAADFMRSEVWACGVAAQAQNDESKLTAFAEQQGLAALTNFQGPGTYDTWWGQLLILHCSRYNSDFRGDPTDNPFADIYHLKGGLKGNLDQLVERLKL